LSDRQQDGAEPLLSIADAAGGSWPSQARAALMALCSSSNSAEESHGAILLADIRDIFWETDAEECLRECWLMLYTVATTPNHYIKAASPDAIAAMKQFSEALLCSTCAPDGDV